MRKTFFLSVLNILTLCVIVASVSLYFIEDAYWVGFVLILLSGLCLVSLIPFKISMSSVLPDIFFGLIDNGMLAVMAIFGGYFAGVAGAVLGGVVGNAVSDGVAGIFEGYFAEKLRSQAISEERTMLKSAVGKMAGCLLGAGFIMSIANFVKF